MEKHSGINFLSRQYMGKLYPLIVWDGKELIGLMPVFFYDIPLRKVVLSPPPSLAIPYLGPVMKKQLGKKPCKKQSIFHEFQKKIDDFLKITLKSNYVQIRTSPGTSDLRPYVWSNYQIMPEYTNFIDLTVGKNKVWENFSQNVRRGVSKANESGISVTTGGREDVESIYSLLLKRQKVPSTKEFLYEIFENFYPDNLNFFIAKKDDVPVTGTINTLYKNNIGGWIGVPKVSIDGVSPNVSPNYPLIWESIQWACNNNYKQFEIIGASDRKTYTFKVQFCGDIAPFYRMKWYSPINRLVISLYRGLNQNEIL
jgi:hypothetical protein